MGDLVASAPRSSGPDAAAQVDVADLAAAPLPSVSFAPDRPEDLAVAEPAGRAEPGPGLRERLLAGGLWPNLEAGAVAGVSAILAALCQAALVFAHPALTQALPLGLAMALTGAAVAALVFAAKGRSPELMAGPESASTAVLCVLAASLAATQVPGAGLTATLAVTLALAGLASGLVLVLAANMRAGHWLRAVPFAVPAGIMAGAGYWLVRAAWDWAMAGHSCLPDLWTALTGDADFGVLDVLRRDPCTRAAAGLGLGFLFMLAARRFRHPLVLPLSAVAAALAAHAVFWAKGLALADLAARGWLLGAAEPVTLFEAVLDAGSVSWPLVLEQAGTVAALAGVLTASAVFKSAALETSLGRELNLDQELAALGRANAVAALAGGLPAGLTLNRTLAAHSAGARGALAGIFSGLLCAGALLAAPRFLPLVPTFVLTALAVAHGLSLIARWLLDVRRDLPRGRDYFPVLAVFGLATLLGPAAGLGCALALGLGMSLSQFSRLRVIKHQLSGDHFHSNVDRAESQIELLRQEGGRIQVLRLQGFLSPAAFSLVSEQVRARVAARDLSPLRSLILDFSYVSGLDAAMSLSFNRLKDMARDEELVLVFTGLSFDLERHLEETGFAFNEEDGGCQSFVDLDHGLEWCENDLLESAGALVMEGRGVEELLSRAFPDPGLRSRLLSRLEEVPLARGQVIFRQGDPPDAMYFVRQGWVNVEIAIEGGRTLRLKKMGPGTVFGEIGLFASDPRTASVVAAEHCELLRLSTGTLESMRASEPRLAAALDQFVVTLLAGRLSAANTMIRDLMR
jgi:SulP family sulfate permease